MSCKLNSYFKSICLFNIVFLFIFLTEGCLQTREIRKNLIQYNDQDWNRDSILVINLRHLDSIVRKSKHFNSLKNSSFYSDYN